MTGYDATEGTQFQRSLHIPLDDPAAAFSFCRQLAQSLDGFGTGDNLLAQPRLNGSATVAASPELSVVLPVFNEKENLPALYRRLTSVLDTEGTPYELVFVDDGSADGSIELLHEMAVEDSRVKVVELARNFGHQIAISAGLDFAQGDAVIVMDADLQDPPEVLPQFIAEWRAGNDVVYAIRGQRKESWPKRMAYAAFYRMLRKASNVKTGTQVGDQIEIRR